MKFNATATKFCTQQEPALNVSALKEDPFQ